MNQFRDLTMCAMIALAIGLGVTDPDNWGWTTLGGSYVVEAVHWLAITRPWSIIVLMALALTLFMTRLRF
jgi:hypothetical protein